MAYQQPREDEWITCPKCATPMVPLRDFDFKKSSETPAPNGELWEFLLFGWWIFVINYLYDLFGYKGRETKARNIKDEVLPRFPNSQICPRCLQIKEKL